MRAFLATLLFTLSAHFGIADETSPEEDLILSTPEQLGIFSGPDFLIKGLISLFLTLKEISAV